MSIRKKLTLVLLAATSLPLIIFIATNFYFSQNIAMKSTMTENYKKTELVQSKIFALINENLTGVKSIARNPIVRSQDAAAMKPVLPETSSFVASKLDGSQFVRSDDGALSNISDRNFFKSAIKGEEDVVSEVLLSKNNGHLITVLATPLKDREDGAITGIVQATIDLDILNSFVKELSTDKLTNKFKIH